MRYIIDRFEENYAVCETEQSEYIYIERNKLPKDAREGDIIVQEESVYTVDLIETEKRKERIKKLADELWK
ncbi:MAG: pyruvate kinase [Clostridia bacterium]|jgi:hypothetical protein|nr:pyruvate kinase [Clostridia bacterium]